MPKRLALRRNNVKLRQIASLRSKKKLKRLALKRNNRKLRKLALLKS
jgi:hypothetical protein